MALGSEFGTAGGESIGQVIAALTQASLALHDTHLDDYALSSLADRIDEKSSGRSYLSGADVMRESAESVGAELALDFINRPETPLDRVSPEMAVAFNAGRFAEALSLKGELSSGLVTTEELGAAISKLCPPPAWPPIC